MGHPLREVSMVFVYYVCYSLLYLPTAFRTKTVRVQPNVITDDIVNGLKEHLDSTDAMGNKKFTDEPEMNGSIPILNALSSPQKTHTDQHLNFMSHHLLNNKLEVIRNPFDKCDNIVTVAVDMD